MNLVFEKVSRKNCPELERERAQYWRGKLSVEQYCERNRILDEHPYGQSSIDCWGIRDKDSGIYLTACDALKLHITYQGVLYPCIHIALVATLPEYRHRGLASMLMQKVVEQYDSCWIRLDSDIDPAFYRRFGFVEFPVMAKEAREEKFENRELSILGELTQQEFYIALSERGNNYSDNENMLWMNPRSELIDWHLERYRFFAKSAGADWSENGIFFSWKHGGENHLFMGVPDFLEKVLLGMVFNEACRDCFAQVKKRMQEHSLDLFRWWGVADVCKIENSKNEVKYPMLRPPQGALLGKNRLNSHLLDWW